MQFKLAQVAYRCLEIILLNQNARAWVWFKLLVVDQSSRPYATWLMDASKVLQRSLLAALEEVEITELASRVKHMLLSETMNIMKTMKRCSNTIRAPKSKEQWPSMDKLPHLSQTCIQVLFHLSIRSRITSNSNRWALLWQPSKRE